MATAHVIEVGDITAGIVVLERGGLRFFASDRAVQALEGALFRTIEQATRAARERLSPRKPGRRPSPSKPDAANDSASTAFGPFAHSS